MVGEEGTFSICTFWACEAAARLGMFKKEYLEKGRLMFEQMLGYANHLGLYSEEIGKRGEHLGNFPQASNTDAHTWAAHVVPADRSPYALCSIRVSRCSPSLVRCSCVASLQAFTHLALISAAINLDRGLNNERGAGHMQQHEVDSPKPVNP